MDSNIITCVRPKRPMNTQICTKWTTSSPKTKDNTVDINFEELIELYDHINLNDSREFLTVVGAASSGATSTSTFSPCKPTSRGLNTTLVKRHTKQNMSRDHPQKLIKTEDCLSCHTNESHSAQREASYGLHCSCYTPTDHLVIETPVHAFTHEEPSSNVKHNTEIPFNSLSGRKRPNNSPISTASNGNISCYNLSNIPKHNSLSTEEVLQKKMNFKQKLDKQLRYAGSSFNHLYDMKAALMDIEPDPISRPSVS
eukprot:Ihof_evm6s67 gene=Ihof_evmTU6s67